MPLLTSELLLGFDAGVDRVQTPDQGELVRVTLTDGQHTIRSLMSDEQARELAAELVEAAGGSLPKVVLPS